MTTLRRPNAVSNLDAAPMAAETFGLTREQMREIGYRVVDAIVDRFAGISYEPASHTAVPLPANLPDEPLPQHAADFDAVLAELRVALSQTFNTMHPRFLAYVPTPSCFVGAMADALASGFSPFTGAWHAGAGVAHIELTTVRWLCELFGLPAATSGGVFVSGGSVANLHALAVARHARFGRDADAARRGIVYGSSECHVSVTKALRVLGLADDQWAACPTRDGGDFRLDLAAVRARVAADRAVGRVPYALVCNAGATSTGACDELDAAADLAAAEGLWLHVDAAYGGAAVLVPEGRDALNGIGRGDSVTFDPHKWLFQPVECAALLVRDAQTLPATFHCVSEGAYMKSADREEEGGLNAGGVNLMECGVQMTRAPRALKLWMSLKVHGLPAFAAAVQRGCDLARCAERLLVEAGCWEVVTPAQLGVITFRLRAPHGGADGGAGDDAERRIDAALAAASERLMRTGQAIAMTTALRGRTVLRLCTIHPRTTEEDLRDVVARLGRLARAAWDGVETQALNLHSRL